MEGDITGMIRGGMEHEPGEVDGWFRSQVTSPYFRLPPGMCSLTVHHYRATPRAPSRGDSLRMPSEAPLPVRCFTASTSAFSLALIPLHNASIPLWEPIKPHLPQPIYLQTASQCTTPQGRPAGGLFLQASRIDLREVEAILVVTFNH